MEVIKKVGDNMEAIGKLFQYIMEGMKTEFTVYGHTLSWWQVFVFTVVIGILGLIIGGIISD